jgi:hypothetical protein
MDSLRTDFPKLSEHRFKEWNTSFHEMIEVRNLLILLKFPKAKDDCPKTKMKESNEVSYLDYIKISVFQKLTV